MEGGQMTITTLKTGRGTSGRWSDKRVRPSLFRLAAVVGTLTGLTLAIPIGMAGATGSSGTGQGSSDASASPLAKPKGYEVVTSGASVVTAGSTATVEATCPANRVVVGGGEDNSSGSTLADLSASYPSGRSWVSTFDNGGTATVTASAKAICIKKPAGFKIVKGPVTNAQQVQTEGLKVCPAGLVVLGGGAKTTDTVDQALNTSVPSANGSEWVVFVNNRAAVPHNFTVFAICADSPAGYVVEGSSVFPSPGSVQEPGDVVCPSGVPLSGGAFSGSSDLYTDINQSEPDPAGWQVTMDNVMSNATSFSVWAVCA
jgi:hypothetical protein